MSASVTTEKYWHTLALDEVREQLDTPKRGLSAAEAERRLQQYGPNQLPSQPPPAWWQILLRQFQSPLIYLLAAAAVVSLILGDIKDASFIGAVLAINALIGGYQEWRAEQSSRALQKLLQIRAAVERDGEIREVPAEAVVPGDLVWLESGNRIPADLRLISAHGLEVDESLLTGESLAVHKDAAWRGADGAPLGDRLNMAFAGAVVVRGRAQGIVVATGTQTTIGELALDVMGAGSGKPPLVERMERFSRTVALAVVASSLVVAGIGIVLRGYTLMEMFFFAVALAVSAIPEGLPAALTVALAIATTRMARRGVIVRRLAAVEGLGSCSMIASDKTGTLTCNELTVQAIHLADGTFYQATGEGFVPEGEVLRDNHPVSSDGEPLLGSLVRAGVLCNEADLHRSADEQWVWRGDAVDVALLSLGRKLAVDGQAMLESCPQVNEIPFEPEHQYAASYHQVGGEVLVFVKGAPERVIGMCDWSDAADRRRGLHQVAESMAEQGYRVLALAEGSAPAGLDESQAPPEPTGLSLIGFVGMIDPLRPGAAEAVTAAQDAGIIVCMITGDHPVTAFAIARDLGFASSIDQVITGVQLAEKSPEELKEVVQRTRVFARVAPRQKLELVQAARDAGHYVAVTGDGVNDAPALRNANIGIAMGKAGTDVAREAAELVISDDNFATIVAGIEEGRVAYDNVRKVIFLLVSTGAAEVIAVGLAIAVGLPLPLLPVQLLWLNLVTNGIQGVALAFEPSEGDVLQRRPRPTNEAVFNNLMIERTVVASLVMGGVGFGTFWWMIEAGFSEASAGNALLLLMVLFENVHIGNCRSETKSAFELSPLRSPILLAGAASAFLLHVLSMHIPFMQGVLGVEPIGLVEWASLIALALTILVAGEVQKLIWRLRGKEKYNSQAA